MSLVVEGDQRPPYFPLGEDEYLLQEANPLPSPYFREAAVHVCYFDDDEGRTPVDNDELLAALTQDKLRWAAAPAGAGRDNIIAG